MELQNNLLKSYKSVSRQTIGSGLNWYKNANKFATYLSNKHKVDFNKVCAVISALSPACNWVQNKKDAQNMIICFANDLNYQDFNFSTYGQNVAKAWNILNYKGFEKLEDVFFSLKTGAKTYSFYLNILNPNDTNHVTIDRHAIAIFEGRKNSGSKSVTPKQYKNIESQYIETAKSLNIIPSSFQAILWEHHVSIIRNN